MGIIIGILILAFFIEIIFRPRFTIIKLRNYNQNKALVLWYYNLKDYRDYIVIYEEDYRK